jgi:hypothetical protein
LDRILELPLKKLEVYSVEEVQVQQHHLFSGEPRQVLLLLLVDYLEVLLGNQNQALDYLEALLGSQNQLEVYLELPLKILQPKQMEIFLTLVQNHLDLVVEEAYLAILLKLKALFSELVLQKLLDNKHQQLLQLEVFLGEEILLAQPLKLLKEQNLLEGNHRIYFLTKRNLLVFSGLQHRIKQIFLVLQLKINLKSNPRPKLTICLENLKNQRKFNRVKTINRQKQQLDLICLLVWVPLLKIKCQKNKLAQLHHQVYLEYSLNLQRNRVQAFLEQLLSLKRIQLLLLPLDFLEHKQNLKKNLAL